VAELRSFVGVRYDSAVTGGLPAVVSAPYDIISPAAQADYYARSRYNIIRLELGQQYKTDRAGSNRYTRAAASYQDFFRAGVLKPDPVPGFYVYDESFDYQGRRLTRRSILAAVRLANWDENVVLPHEFTLPRAKEDRLCLLAATRTQFSPLLATYDDPGTVLAAVATTVSQPPVVEFELPTGSVAASATSHRLWQLTDPGPIASIVSALATSPIYIADGHHRYETALAYRDRRRAEGAGPDSPSEYVLMALVAKSDPGLLVLPTHRMIVGGLGAIDRQRALSALQGMFQLERQALGPNGTLPPADSWKTETASRPDRRPSIVSLGLEPGFATRLTLRADLDLATLLPDDPPVLRGLDTLILQRLVFESVLGLSRAEAEAGERIRYTRDPEEALDSFTSGQAQLVFFLSPTSIESIKKATGAGVRMPQKTTYFYPKPVTGLVLYDHNVAW
jgi:uncharacterized protein (DUF1015 family)